MSTALRDAIASLPDEASVPIYWIRELLGQAEDVLVDLTLEDVAERTGKAVSTVRGWCSSGELRAYKLHGKQWRIPHAALGEFFKAQQSHNHK